MNEKQSLREGQIMTGSLFNEPMRVETVRSDGPGTWVAGLVGVKSERFRKITLTSRDSGAEAKLSKLKGLLQQEGFFDHPEKRLLIFTEFKDTLDYLLDRLKSWGFRVGARGFSLQETES